MAQNQPPQFQIGNTPPPPPRPIPPPVVVPPQKSQQMNPVYLTLILSALALFITFTTLVSMDNARKEAAQRQKQEESAVQSATSPEMAKYRKAAGYLWAGSKIYIEDYQGTLHYVFTVLDPVYHDGTDNRQWILVEYPDGTIERKLRSVATAPNMWTENHIP